MLLICYLVTLLSVVHGYDNLPTGTDHLVHHMKFMVNFGNFGILDDMNGTFVSVDRSIEKRNSANIRFFCVRYSCMYVRIYSMSNCGSHVSSFVPPTPPVGTFEAEVLRNPK